MKLFLVANRGAISWLVCALENMNVMVTCNGISWRDHMILYDTLRYDKVFLVYILVGGLVAISYFRRNIGLLIIPIDELIFFRGVAQPPTSW